MKNDKSVIILGILLVLTYAISKIYSPNDTGKDSKSRISKKVEKISPVVINSEASMMVSDTLPYKVLEAR
ncbi:hypothetical protein R9C00_15520 [Flammeovirgaceae bacterium SG7u.111]|nr:hypothetical protein [Flammeovirgaceae bacterium SG7u.132]WPO33112.1 hypothetical protein R9C00_15520 [Flammeovirgaceae bacterium SG7u.111]